MSLEDEIVCKSVNDVSLLGSLTFLLRTIPVFHLFLDVKIMTIVINQLVHNDIFVKRMLLYSYNGYINLQSSQLQSTRPYLYLFHLTR